MSNGGYGIAGHKNSYKTGILNGNWVQDTIGKDLVANQVGKTFQMSGNTGTIYIC
jgi:hypothetical protein